MNDIPEPLRHADSASQQHDVMTSLIGFTYRFRHFFHAAMKFFARLALHKKRRTSRTQLLEIQPTIGSRQVVQLIGSDENVVGRKRNPTRIGSLFVSLFEG